MIVIRRGDRLDIPFLRSLLSHAYGRHLSDEDTGVVIFGYLADWGRHGDTALVAMDAGHSVGAGWYRLSSDASHGYGFVDAETPELTVVVVPSRQGEGIGQMLLAALCERAEQDGYPGLSASVESDDPDRESLSGQGFQVVAEHGTTLTMLRRFGSEQAPSRVARARSASDG